jgi:hypothetical protein
MTNLIRISIPLILLASILFGSCKKSNSGSALNLAINDAFHKDYELANGSGILHTLLFSALSDNATIVNIKTNGSTSAAAETFQLMFIDKNQGLKSITHYNLDPTYNMYQTTCAVMDKNENIWLGGLLQKSDTAYSKPFIIELDKAGNVLSAKYFPIYDVNLEQNNYRGYSLKVLNNGDLLYIVSMRYDLELIRMNASGNVSWIKQYINPTGSVFQPENSNIVETSTGELIFIVSSSGLFKTDANGNIIYQFALPVVGLSSKLYALSTGDLIITGENENGGPQQDPYIFKIDPSSGSVLKSKIMTGITNNIINNLFNDIQEVNGQLKFTHSSDSQYNTITMDENLNILKIQRTLSHIGGFGYSTGIRSWFDAPNNAIYHNIDIHGPGGTFGFQLLKTDLNGKSCHDDPGAAVAIPLADINIAPTPLNYAVSVPVHIPVAVPFVVTKTSSVTVQPKDGCTE